MIWEIPIAGTLMTLAARYSRVETSALMKASRRQRSELSAKMICTSVMIYFPTTRQRRKQIEQRLYVELGGSFRDKADRDSKRECAPKAQGRRREVFSVILLSCGTAQMLD
jgi:hypothetical protein